MDEFLDGLGRITTDGVDLVISVSLLFDRFANEAKRTATFISALVHPNGNEPTPHGMAANLRIYCNQLLTIFSISLTEIRRE